MAEVQVTMLLQCRPRDAGRHGTWISDRVSHKLYGRWLLVYNLSTQTQERRPHASEVDTKSVKQTCAAFPGKRRILSSWVWLS